MSITVKRTVTLFVLLGAVAVVVLMIKPYIFPAKAKASASASQASSFGPVAIAVGNKAPNFQLATPKGGYVTLSALRGRPVMLNFWATWCTACRAEYPYLVQEYKQYGSQIAWYAVDEQQSTKTVMSYVQKFQVPFPILLDPQGLVGGDYNVTGFPTTIFINKRGVIVAVQRGAFGSPAQIAHDIKLAEG